MAKIVKCIMSNDAGLKFDDNGITLCLLESLINQIDHVLRVMV